MTDAARGERDLNLLLRSLQARRKPGVYGYVCIEQLAALNGIEPVACLREDEGWTVILPIEQIAELGLTCRFEAAWLSLEVHSDLQAVGLTAALASALGDAGISCNVWAGNYHDHLLVPVDQADRALDALAQLQQRATAATTSGQRELYALTVLVDDYDRAIRHYVDDLGFVLREDSPRDGGKRWVRVAPRAEGTALLLAQAANEAQRAAIGRQTGGRVGFFLHTDDFDRDYRHMQSRGVHFCETPRDEPYGRVVVFEDAFGNRWDLLQSRTD